ncbi:MAG: molybdopterin-dependent oxidoreductase [Deltaproteobacteria bacterium]|nr:molybdopterin-dependent oxidoreductase [Deltaproteobacteria bacterium]
MKKRGRGLAAIYFGMGNTAKPNPSSAHVELLEDGSALVRCGAADLGQGSDTALSQVAAEALGLSPERVSIKSADTLTTPEAGVSSASRQTYVSGNAIRLAGQQIAKQLVNEAATDMEARPEDLVIRQDRVFVQGSPDKFMAVKDVVQKLRAKGVLTSASDSFNPPTAEMLDPETGRGVPFGAYSYATQMVEVEVDTETGLFEVLRVVAAHDVGRAVNPMGVEGQIEGGVVMGLGYAIMEEIVWDKGLMQTTGFGAYLLPTSLDAPPITSIIVEEPEPTGPFGAKGTGEPPCCPTAAALVNAIYDAVGVNITSLPVTAEKVFLGLQQLKEANRPGPPP